MLDLDRSEIVALLLGRQSRYGFFGIVPLSRTIARHLIETNVVRIEPRSTSWPLGIFHKEDLRNSLVAKGIRSIEFRLEEEYQSSEKQLNRDICEAIRYVTANTFIDYKGPHFQITTDIKKGEITVRFRIPGWVPLSQPTLAAA